MTYDQWKTTDPREYEPCEEEERPEPLFQDWHELADQKPPLNQLCVCTDGKHRWLDMLTPYSDDLVWQDHKAMYWFPVPELNITEREQLKRQAVVRDDEIAF